MISGAEETVGAVESEEAIEEAVDLDCHCRDFPARDFLDLQEAVEVVDDGLEPERFEKIAGHHWEFTNKFDCWGHDIATYPVHVWGTPGGKADREKCAQECIDHDYCVAFNFPSPAFPDPKDPFAPQVCYLKFTHMHSKKMRLDCEKGFDTDIWHYYTMTDSQVWQRMSSGLRKSRFPFTADVPQAEKAKKVWISDIRWEVESGLICLPGKIATYPVQVSSDPESELAACAQKCVDHQECVAFSFPQLGDGDKWDASAGQPECRLKSGGFKELGEMFKCEQDGSSDSWRSFTLSDAWKEKFKQVSRLHRQSRSHPFFGCFS